MHSALGHCQDPECLQSSSTNDSVRLFRCSIHCDRNLCLFHLNAHNILYEQAKKQNDIIINELQNALTLYQTVFEQHMITYRELVRQASGILLHNSSSLVPIEQIRPVLENIQQATSNFRQDIIVIKCEPSLNNNTITNEVENKNDNDKENVNTSIDDDGCQKFVVRIPRLEPSVNTESVISFGNDTQGEEPASPVYTTRRASEGRKTKGTSVKRLQK